MVATGKYQVITRTDIDRLLANQQIQVSSISSAENIRKLQLQNISYIVTGSVDAMGNDYAVTLRILDVSSGRFGHSANAFMASGSRDLYNGVTQLVNSFAAGMTSQGGQVAQGSGGNYKVGDTGPGGGTVFFAERGAYMEVSGLLLRADWDEAVTFVRNYRGGGYSDWRLPTRGELDIVYRNLRAGNIGDLGNDLHWSSSEYLNNVHAWSQRFSDGSQDYRGKSYTLSVRAIRAF
jgi:hypothetical protein